MDYSRTVIAAKAADAIARHGGPDLVRVFYKWTCPNCATRNVVDQPNWLPETAMCADCCTVARISHAGFALHMRRSVDIGWDQGRTLVVTKG